MKGRLLLDTEQKLVCSALKKFFLQDLFYFLLTQCASYLLNLKFYF